MTDSLSQIWNKLTAPQSTDPDEARREYMTKVILVIISAVFWVSVPLMGGTWVIDAVPVDMLIVAVLLSALFSGGWWLAHKGHWRVSGYIVPWLLFALAVRDSYVYGVGATNIMEYTTAILLTAILHGPREQWLALLVSISASMGFQLLHLQRRTTTLADFGYWGVTVGFFYVVVFLLLRFFTAQFQQALDRVRAVAQAMTEEVIARRQAEKEIKEYRDHLEDLVEQRTAELRDSEEKFRELAENLEELVEQRTRELEEERANLAQRVAERTSELRTANAELARAARLKDEFMANMSHELRTPLNAVLGMAEALQEQFMGPLNEAQLKSVRAVEESGRHLLSLINDILDLSKIEAGKLELYLETVSVETISQASLQFIKQMAHKKRIKISFDIEPNLKDIRADQLRLKQILVNLLTNAVKFTPTGGQVGLEVTADVQNEMILFSVWDTGIGISQRDIARLFQPFMQVDSSLSRKHEGTGLGLALVARLARLHGGNVMVESEREKGSRFTVSLPYNLPSCEKDEVDAADEEATSPAPTPCDADATPNKQAPLIMLAEDNETNIQTTADYLRIKGYRVEVARDGIEAVELAKHINPTLILMDIQLPRVNGLEAIRQLRAAAETEAVPIIALTALAMPGDRERCLAAGADDYLSKPVSLKKLVAKMKTFVAEQ